MCIYNVNTHVTLSSVAQWSMPPISTMGFVLVLDQFDCNPVNCAGPEWLGGRVIGFLVGLPSPVFLNTNYWCIKWRNRSKSYIHHSCSYLPALIMHVNRFIFCLSHFWFLRSYNVTFVGVFVIVLYYSTPTYVNSNTLL